MMLLIPASELIARLRDDRGKRAVRPKPKPPVRH